MLVNLAKNIGLNISLDLHNKVPVTTADVEYTSEHVQLHQIAPILLNKYIKYPEIVFYNYSLKTAELDNSEIKTKLVLIPPGLLGIEFIKTHIYKTREGINNTVLDVSMGNVILILQKNAEVQDIFNYTKVAEVHLVKLTKGSRVVIPGGFLFTLVNTSPDAAIISISHTGEFCVEDYAKLARERGLSYFVINKNSKTEIVANPKYRVACTKPKLNSWEKIDPESIFYRYNKNFDLRGGTVLNLIKSGKLQ